MQKDNVYAILQHNNNVIQSISTSVFPAGILIPCFDSWKSIRSVNYLQKLKQSLTIPALTQDRMYSDEKNFQNQNGLNWKRLIPRGREITDLCRAWCYRSDAPGFLPGCLHTTSHWCQGLRRFGSSAADPLHRTANKSPTPPTLSMNSSWVHSQPLHMRHLHLGTYYKRHMIV